jgi:prepilin-type N-terminal cleavage/methylation domain-containing protein
MISPTSPTRPGVSGFSMIELLAALVILGILAALAAPSFGGVTARASTRGALDQVTADLLYARMLAVREGRQAELEFQTATKYTVVVDPSGAPRTAKVVELARDYAGLRLTPPVGNKIRFNSRGLLQTTTANLVKATRANAVDSVVITPLGQPYRAY